MIITNKKIERDKEIAKIRLINAIYIISTSYQRSIKRRKRITRNKATQMTNATIPAVVNEVKKARNTIKGTKPKPVANSCMVTILIINYNY